jgi:hypothetical protein
MVLTSMTGTDRKLESRASTKANEGDSGTYLRSVKLRTPRTAVLSSRAIEPGSGNNCSDRRPVGEKLVLHGHYGARGSRQAFRSVPNKTGISDFRQSVRNIPLRGITCEFYVGFGGWKAFKMLADSVP